MKFNTLASLTFGWLKMSDGELLDLPAIERLSLAVELSEGTCIEKLNDVRVREIRTGGGEEFGQALAAAKLPVLICTVPAGRWIVGRDALRLSLKLPDEDEEYDPEGRIALRSAKTVDAPAQVGKFTEIELNPGAGSSLTVAMDYCSEEDAKGFVGVQTRIMTGEDVKFTLVQIVRPGSSYTLLDDVGTVHVRGAELRMIYPVLSDEHVYQGFSPAMKGDRSQVTVDVGYVGEDHMRYDLDYENIHTGKKTGAETRGKGVPRGYAKEAFRDSIGFRKDCSGSEGNETEDVLFMDETVGNCSLPIILCSKDDAVGNHGATIGHLSEDLFFYMESRGMQKDDAYEMMVKARTDTVVRKISDTKTRHDLLELDDEEERGER